MMNQDQGSPGDHLARVGSIVLFLLLAVFVLLTYDQHGISNDEEVQHVYGRLLLNYYGSGLTDLGAFNYKNLYLYGGFFDLLAALLERGLSMDIWDLRHLLSAGFGLFGLLGTWKLARYLGGEKMAFLSLLLLALTGSWSGAMFTHTKDIPFATCMIWALYYTTRLLPELPSPSRGLLLKLGLALGCAFGLRVGAVFAVFYLGVAMLLWNVLVPGAGSLLQRLLRSFLALWPAALVAILVMGICWPWSVMGWNHLFLAATTFSHFSFELTTIVNGVVMKNGEVPATYLLTYLLIRLPELTLLGLLALVACPIFCQRSKRREVRAEAGSTMLWLPVLLAVLVPLTYTLLARPALYNGIRHFIFLLPPISILAAWGLKSLGVNWSRSWLKLPYVLFLAILALFQIVTLARLHPYEYIAYNQLVGGVQGAPGRWELDYWASSLRHGAGQLNAYAHREGVKPAVPYPVAVCAENLQGSAYLDPQFFQVTKDWRKAEFFLGTTHMNCHQAMRGRQIGEVSRVGVPLLVVLDRRGLVGDERTPK